MKLVNAEIRRYRSIEDGSKVAIENDVTCLVGKNESGKSAILQALYKSAPIESASKFDIGLDYPSRLTRETRGTEPIAVTILEYVLSDEDVSVLEAKFGEGVVRDRRIQVTTRYRARPNLWVVRLNEQAAANNLKGMVELPGSMQKDLDAATSVAEVMSVLRRADPATEAVKSVIAFVETWRNEDVDLAAVDLLNSRRPKFVYFSDYDSMPGKVSIPDLIAKRDAETLSRPEQAVLSLLDLAGVALEEFLDPESHEHLIRNLENASNSITDEVFEYWSQNKNLAVKLTDIGKAEDNAVPPLDVPPLLQIRVENQRHRVTVPFDERSRGFVWFFSFLAYFSDLEERAEQPLILLLDEPGINLHASAQADLLRFIDERLAPKHQVIFSTHSPFMIDAHALHRVRTVVDADGEGTKVSSDVLYSDSETSFPLHAAIGVELSQTLFVAPNVLLVEGPSDLIYVDTLSNALIEAGREGLSSEWAITPVGGARKLPAFLTLLGANKLNAVILADAPFEDAAFVAQLRKTGKLGTAGVVAISDATGQSPADVEDLFEPGFYLDLVRDAYAGALAGVSVKVSDLPAGDRLVKRMEQLFRDKGYNGGVFNHFSPASALVRGQGKFVKKLNPATLDRAEALFKAVNAFLQ